MKLPVESAWLSAVTPPLPNRSLAWLPTSELAAETAPATPVVPLPQVTAPEKAIAPLQKSLRTT